MAQFSVCGTPYQIDNGNYTISNDGMSVVYTCHTSYTLVGDDTLHCGTDGSGWQGATPKCGKNMCHMVSLFCC